MKNLVSIITPTFNSSRYIEKCIGSVISQSYTNWELILVDDDSTDKTQQIIIKYSRKYKKIKSQSSKTKHNNKRFKSKVSKASITLILNRLLKTRLRLNNFSMIVIQTLELKFKI